MERGSVARMYRLTVYDRAMSVDALSIPHSSCPDPLIHWSERRLLCGPALTDACSPL